MGSTQIEKFKTQNQEKTIKELKEEFNLVDFKLPEWLDDGDIIELTEDELKKLREEINITDTKEKALIFKKFLEWKINTINAESKDNLKKLVQETQNNLKKSIPHAWVPLTIAWATAALEPIQETISAMKEWVQELLTPIFTLLASIPIIWWIFKWLWELFGLNLNIVNKAKEVAGKMWDEIEELKLDFNDPKTKEELINQLKVSIPKDISKRYGIDFSKKPEKLKELNELITESYGKLNDDKLREFLEKVKDPFKNWIFVKDSFWVLSNIVLTSVFFTFWLVTRWIVDTYDIAFDFAEKWVNSIVLTINWIWQAFWVKKLISLENFWNMVNEMDAEAKEKSIALIYREWWLFFSILWWLWYWSYKLLNSFLTDTSANWFSMFANSMTNNYDKLIRDFAKIESALWENATKFWWIPILNDARLKAEAVQNNYKLLKVLNSSWYEKSKILEYFTKTTDWKELAKKFDWLVKSIESIPDNMPKDWVSSKISELAKTEVWKARINIEKWEWKNFKWNFTRNQTWRLNEFYTSINDTLDMQQRLASEWKWWPAKLFKVFESQKLAHVSRNWDRLTFAFDNATNFKTWIKELNQAWPDILRGVLGKLPIIAVWWMAITSEEPIKALKEDIWMIIPVIWPVMMIWWIWLDTEWKVTWIWDATMWAALLTLDWYHLIKWGMKWVLPYLIKPGVDVYEILRWTTRFSWMTWKAIVSSSTSLWNIAKEAAEKLKVYKITPKQKQAFAIAMIAMIWYIWYQQYTKDHLSEEEAYKIAKDPNNKDKDIGLVAIIETKLKEFWAQNSKVEINWKEIKISWIESDTLKNWIDYLRKDIVKWQLNLLWLSWYEIKFV